MPIKNFQFRNFLFVLLIIILVSQEKDSKIIIFCHGLSVQLNRFDFLHHGLLILMSSSLSNTEKNGNNDNEIIKDTDCSNGGLVPEIQIPGAYQSKCMTQLDRIIQLNGRNNNNMEHESSKNKKDSTIIIHQEPSGSGSTGKAVWNSGLVLTRLLIAIQDNTNMQQQQQQQSSPWKDQTVLELGCGTGLVSIAISKLLQAKSVIATDGNPQVVELANYNVLQNQVNDNVQTATLQWGLLNAMDYDNVADWVVGSDLTYNSGTWSQLAETMATIVRPKGNILYVSCGHSGFPVQAEVDGFLTVAKSKGLQINMEETNKLTKLLETKVLSSQEKQLLNGNYRVVLLQRTY